MEKYVRHSIKESFRMLAPHIQIRNSVMFVVYVAAIAMTAWLLREAFQHYFSWFNFQIALWLWLTVLFANFSEALAECRAKANLENINQSQEEAMATIVRNGYAIPIQTRYLHKGDIVVCEVGNIIPADGEVIEGVATVDESAITGESASVIRESGGDRSAVTEGTRIVSDIIKIRLTSDPGKGFLNRKLNLIESGRRLRTPNEYALEVVLSGLTILFLLLIPALKLYINYTEKIAGQNLQGIVTLPILIALLVCLIPTTISSLLNAVSISGMDRLLRRNVIAKNSCALEAAGDIDLLILDKTGTITMGNRTAISFIPIQNIEENDLAKIAQLASIADETPEGRSIMILAKDKYDLTPESLDMSNTKFIPFSAISRMSGIDFKDDQGNIIRSIRKGAPEAIRQHIGKLGGIYPKQLDAKIHGISQEGGTPLLVSDGKNVLGIIYLKDVIKRGIKEKCAEMREMGIRTVMITGDNAFTAAAIAAEAGVYDFIADASPEIKLDLIRQEQNAGSRVAMTGDGTNDAPALAQANVGVAMNTGTQISRGAGNMVDLDSNPTKLLDIVEIGKQLLMTRGALTIFSLTNCLAKYFALLPTIFGFLYASHGHEGPLSALNIMSLHSPKSAVLSTLIFNALIILALIPLALIGVRYRGQTAYKLLLRNTLIYGLGGLIMPFIGIKVIDLIVGRFL